MECDNMFAVRTAKATVSALVLPLEHKLRRIFLQAQASGSSQALPKLRSGDMLWSTFLAGSTAGSSDTRPLPHIVDAAAPSTILFSSGTTVRHPAGVAGEGKGEGEGGGPQLSKSSLM
jgi:hypothetical protein